MSGAVEVYKIACEEFISQTGRESLKQSLCCTAQRLCVLGEGSSRPSAVLTWLRNTTVEGFWGDDVT